MAVIGSQVSTARTILTLLLHSTFSTNEMISGSSRGIPWFNWTSFAWGMIVVLIRSLKFALRHFLLVLFNSFFHMPFIVAQPVLICPSLTLILSLYLPLSHNLHSGGCYWRWWSPWCIGPRHCSLRSQTVESSFPPPLRPLGTLHYTTLHYSTVQYSTEQYSTVQYSTVQYSTVQYSTVQYSIAQYSTVQYSTVQYSTVQCGSVEVSDLLPQHLFLFFDLWKLLLRLLSPSIPVVDFLPFFTSFSSSSLSSTCHLLHLTIIFFSSSSIHRNVPIKGRTADWAWRYW